MARLTAFLIVAGLLAVVCCADRNMLSRDIGCANLTPSRGQDICRSISKSMEWTWMGHAIVSPGWRPTASSVAKVYCAQNIGSADLPVLESLRRQPDWRLESGAESLSRVVKNIDGAGGEPENSVFSPKNPSDVLKNGCR